MPAHTTRPWRRPEPSWVFAGAAALRQLLLGSLWRCPILIFISRINLRSWFPLLPLLLLFLPGLEGESERFSEELGTIYIHSWHEPAALQHQAQPSLRGLALARGVRDRRTSPDPPPGTLTWPHPHPWRGLLYFCHPGLLGKRRARRGGEQGAPSGAQPRPCPGGSWLQALLCSLWAGCKLGVFGQMTAKVLRGWDPSWGERAAPNLAGVGVLCDAGWWPCAVPALHKVVGFFFFFSFSLIKINKDELIPYYRYYYHCYNYLKTAAPCNNSHDFCNTCTTPARGDALRPRPRDATCPFPVSPPRC